MKRFSVILIIILALFTLTSCQSLGLPGLFDSPFWDWNLKDSDLFNDKEVEKTADSVVAVIDDSVSKAEKKIEVIQEKVPEKTKETVKEEVQEIKEVIVEEVKDVKQEGLDVVKEISEWFEVKEEQVKEAVSEAADVVETTAQTLEKSVTDVLKSMESEPVSSPVISVPAEKETPVETTKEEPVVVEEKTTTPEPVVLSATEQANAAESTIDEIESIGSSAVLIIILVAVGLIGIAIAYYCISIKKKSY